MIGELLCRLGVHRPTWSGDSRTFYSAPAWLQVRICARCGIPVAR